MTSLAERVFLTLSKVRIRMGRRSRRPTIEGWKGKFRHIMLQLNQSKSPEVQDRLKRNR
jgi:hypothetical protein